MKSSKLVELLKKGNFVVPLYLFQLKDKINVDFDEFIFLIYLTNLGDKFVFDPNKLSNDLNISLPEVLSYIDDLSEKNYLSIDVIKNDKNEMEEYIKLDLFYDKVSNFMIDDINSTDKNDSSIYDIIAKEFARPLSSMEMQIISAWLEDGTSEEIIIDALKESVYSGVCNLRYIDKIIYEWTKKGIKTHEDVEKNRKDFKFNQEKKEKLDLFDYDWLDDDDE